jgi:uncharacterized membrane protein
MDILTIVLRIIHIFAGVFWVGSAWLFAFFLGPATQALGADGGKFIGHLVNKMRLTVYITVSAILAVLAGLILFFLHYGIAGLSTPTGLVFGIGGVFGLVGLGIGGGLVGPTSLKLTQLGGEIARAGKPPTSAQQAEMSTLQKRLSSASLWNAIVVSLALLTMAAARYL